MPNPSPADRITVRQATPDDLADVTVLLSLRDAKRHKAKHVADYLWQLESARTRAWIALSGKRPVGVTMLYLRDMAWPTADKPDQIVRAGYWAHLFVDPEFRKQMVYPQLVLAMIRGLKDSDIDLLYTGTRQPHVAEGHQKLGFHLVGKLPVRLRPLQPFRLLAKHQVAGAVAPLARPFDMLYEWCSFTRPAAAVHVEPLDLDGPEVQQLADLLNTQPPGTVHQRWTAELLRLRYRATLAGSPYRISAVRRNGKLTAAILTTLAVRGNDIRTGVILELAADPQATDQEVQSLLCDAEQFARSHDADLMLSLPCSLADPRTGKLSAKYLTTHSEEYHLLVYPKSFATGDQAAADLAHWNFTFGDHDAF